MNNMLLALQAIVTAGLATIPVLEKKTQEEMQILINTHTWEEGVLYYTVEED